MRLFVAIKIPQDALGAIGRAAAHLEGALGARVLPLDNIHITLKFLGEVGDGRLSEVKEALATVKFSPFKVKLFGAGAFPSHQVPRAIYIGGESDGASGLSGEVGKALSFLPDQDGKPFRLHLTIARSKGAADISEFLEKTNEVATFEVRSFQLMRSRLAATGATYEVLREFMAEGV